MTVGNKKYFNLYNFKISEKYKLNITTWNIDNDDAIDDLPPSDSMDNKQCCYGLFRIQNLVEGFAAVLKKRPHHKRSFIILLIIAFQLEMFALHGKWNCMFLYFRRVLNWSIVEFSRYSSILGGLGLIAQYALVPILSLKLKLHDSTIAMIGNNAYYIINKQR